MPFPSSLLKLYALDALSYIVTFFYLQRSVLEYFEVERKEEIPSCVGATRATLRGVQEIR